MMKRVKTINGEQHLHQTSRSSMGHECASPDLLIADSRPKCHAVAVRVLVMGEGEMKSLPSEKKLVRRTPRKKTPMIGEEKDLDQGSVRLGLSGRTRSK
mmetsp:Transcript_24296/g.35046  ORF Transcript_24296/g.35046 Transcript_24296/m.35046 type:complete len:99 (+) Transcript_24296:1047-1343(+)